MPLHYTLRQLEYFVAVGEAGSIAKASERVNVSSPSISAAITQLEDAFGLRLFVRKHAHGLTLTQAGQQFMTQAHRVLGEAKAMNSLAERISGNVQGPLKVGCLLTFAQLIVPSLRRGFEAEYPRVSVSQSELDQMEIFENLRRAEIDIALTYDLNIPDDVAFIPLAKLPPYAMLHKTHPLADLTSVSLQQLQDYPMVLLNLPYSGDYFLSLFDATGTTPKIVERTKDMAVLRSLVANGFGYTLANIRPLSAAAPDGQPLTFLPLRGPVRPLHLGVALVDETANVLTVKTFIEHCRSFVQATDILGPGPAINTASAAAHPGVTDLGAKGC